jgi:azurin
MKNLSFLILSLSVLLHASCTKDKFITSPDARISFSVDTVRFDTVFTSAGSITQTVKIFNLNNQKLNISSIELMGGRQSSFRINADGIPGPLVNNLEIDPNDSLYVFVTVNINPNAAESPFLVNDSIRINHNGVNSQIQLQAYGQNAHYYRGVAITSNTTWDKTLPYVILGGLQVDTGITLTINAGTRIYLHADAPFIVDGTVIANGTKKDSITFQGDRLDKDYRDFPAAFPGIFFANTSRNNTLRYVIVKNGYQGIVCEQQSATYPKLELNQCTVNNIYDAGILGINSSIKAVNCLVSNCGVNILLTDGGNYEFTHCTAASYNDLFIQHKKPVLVISNWDSTSQLLTYDLQVLLQNNIFWGESGNIDDEVLVSRKGNKPFNVLMENNLFKAKNTPPNTTLINNLQNQPPLFDSVNEALRYYDFRIGRYPSPAVNAGKNLGIPVDLDGNPRDSKPDIGSYEKQ